MSKSSSKTKDSKGKGESLLTAPRSVGVVSKSSSETKHSKLVGVSLLTASDSAGVGSSCI